MRFVEVDLTHVIHSCYVESPQQYSAEDTIRRMYMGGLLGRVSQKGDCL